MREISHSEAKARRNNLLEDAQCNFEVAETLVCDAHVVEHLCVFVGVWVCGCARARFDVFVCIDLSLSGPRERESKGA